MRVHLIRHGQSANNALPEYQRIEDPALTPIGREQAERLGNWAAQTPLHTLLVSPFLRTLETAAPIHRSTGLKPQVWVDLHERGGCYAGWQPSNFRGRPGMNAAEIRERFPQVELVDDIHSSGWWQSQPRESDEQALQRARRIVDRLRRTFHGTGQQVACVMHADFKMLVTSVLFDRPYDPTLPAIYRNASITTFELDAQGRPVLIHENRVEHLEEELWSG